MSRLRGLPAPSAPLAFARVTMHNTSRALAHTTNTHGGFDTGVRPYARRSVDDNLAPHGWSAAERVARTGAHVVV